jgi:hypothetical protein
MTEFENGSPFAENDTVELIARKGATCQPWLTEPRRKDHES